MKGKSSTRKISGLFFAIIICLFILPFFIVPLRYEVGGVLEAVIDGIGRFSLMGGFLSLIIGIALVLTTHGTKWLMYLTVGVVLLWVGCMCTGIAIDIFGFIIGGSGSTGGSGYH